MDTGDFLYTQEAYEGEIEIIMTHIINCYQLMIDTGKKIANDENKIRNILIKDYLTNSAIKKQIGIKGYKFRPEIAVIDFNYDEIGYTDIEVSLLSHFEDDQAIFIIECKRIDGENDLNRYYVKDGVMRFIQNQYPSYFKLNGMLGFCVSSFDINVNISNINDHLTKWCIAHTQQHISKLSYVDGFEYTYTSYHTLEKETDKKIRLYHTMLDFSTLIDL